MKRAHNFIDLTGENFGRLRVVRESSEKTFEGKPKWECDCECGNKCTVSATSLRRGKSQSCGCLMKQRTARANTRHGKKGSRVYRIWTGMKNRCLNPNSKDFDRYGGRGITVCDRWLTFENFYQDMGDVPEGRVSIERKDNSKPYCKENCQWGTATEQANNRRNNRPVEFNGKTQNLGQWEKELGFPNGRLGKRINAGWTVLDAFTTPVNSNLSRQQSKA